MKDECAERVVVDVGQDTFRHVQAGAFCLKFLSRSHAFNIVGWPVHERIYSSLTPLRFCFLTIASHEQHRTPYQVAPRDRLKEARA
jgi:hypothetical protein